MDKFKAIPIVLAVIVLAATACTPTAGEPAPDATKIFLEAQATLIAQQAAEEAAKPVEPEPVVEEAAAPAVSEEEAPTSTSSVAVISVSQGTNCRSGPGNEYPVVAFVEPGVQLEIVGWEGYGVFYVVKNPQGGEDCWLWAEYATLEGDTSNLAKVEIPNTPEGTVSWAGTWQMLIDGKTIPVVLTQESKVIKGFFKIGDLDYSFSGVVNADNTQVNGYYSDSDENEGQFIFSMVVGTTNQFQGMARPAAGKQFAWCGHRSGAGMPGTCMLQ